MRLATELVAGAAVGTGIGWGVDRFFNTSPWATLVFSVLGWIAGLMNAYRAVKGMDNTVGFGAAVERSQTSDKDNGKGSDGV
jgi:ATP synthase protein I